jgi:hypothetical protein
MIVVLKFDVEFHLADGRFIQVFVIDYGYLPFKSASASA